MSKSTKRVARALADAGIEAAVLNMPDSTRTAAEAAAACGCAPDQIVKSLIFLGAESDSLCLLLVRGSAQVDLDKAAAQIGEPLVRADAKRVRDETGFAIGGVAPVGHLAPLRTWMDAQLLEFDTVWAAAGAPNAVFQIAPEPLRNLTGATLFDPN